MKNLITTLVLVLAVYPSFSQQRAASNSHPAKLADGISIASLTEEGINADKINMLTEEISKNTYPNVHSLLISRHNRLLYEHYWPGEDQHWGNPVGIVPHDRDSLHDIRSISKSIVSACIGIAIQQGKIKSVDQKVLSFFPAYAAQDTGMKSALTIRHLLSMSSGLVWNEDVPYDNPENSEIRMINSPDPIGYVLIQPMEAAPGKLWKYNGGTTQLLAAIIERTTGKPIDQFAHEYLFKPLGITSFQWVKYPGTTLPAAASGLRLRSRDLLKFGLLYNNNGLWQGKQIVPAPWVKESFQPQVTRRGGAYGYQFWIWNDTVDNKPVHVVNCVGNGDQRIIFDKEHDLVVVITAGNYNKWDIKENSTAIMQDYIIPAVGK
ncbi:serine hydrolase domain-containing protein [Chitinophaga ginsengisoli]|uniref:CubicO group peptidase (Beta-lactamase class C family) n=1 Tax=Chitinophaga ginsengisoli TaxID=363837 RepID=A0A2P8GKG6_9BACT|nr:serine hydrolase [Chitinophaga ginsengisoli]PSL34445.1 CubicO group peptidase (beta-lactamase class C family) [Chitinophaga ginsengisoli]